MMDDAERIRNEVMREREIEKEHGGECLRQAIESFDESLRLADENMRAAKVAWLKQRDEWDNERERLELAMNEICEEAGVHTQVLRDEIEDVEACLLRAEIAGIEVTFTNLHD